jgi:hypothetical protein
LIVRSEPVRPELEERRGKEGERNENEPTIPRAPRAYDELRRFFRNCSTSISISQSGSSWLP